MSSNGRLGHFLRLNRVRGRDRIFTITDACSHYLLSVYPVWGTGNSREGQQNEAVQVP